MKLLSFAEGLLEGTKKNSPTILTALTLLGIAGTAWSAYKAGLQARDIIEEAKKDLKDVAPDDKPARRAVMKETTVKMAKVLAPTIVMGAATGGCALGSNRINNKRVAVLSAGYKMMEQTARELDQKMQETLGVKKAREIKDAILKDDLKKEEARAGVPNTLVVGPGDVLCYERKTNQWFASNAVKLDEAIRKVSDDCKSEMWVSLNDFLYELGPNLRESDFGNDIGWDPDMLEGYPERLPISYTAILTEDKRPALCLDYDWKIRQNRF